MTTTIESPVQPVVEAEPLTEAEVDNLIGIASAQQKHATVPGRIAGESRSWSRGAAVD